MQLGQILKEIDKPDKDDELAVLKYINHKYLTDTYVSLYATALERKWNDDLVYPKMWITSHHIIKWEHCVNLDLYFIIIITSSGCLITISSSYLRLKYVKLHLYVLYPSINI